MRGGEQRKTRLLVARVTGRGDEWLYSVFPAKCDSDPHSHSFISKPPSDTDLLHISQPEESLFTSLHILTLSHSHTHILFPAQPPARACAWILYDQHTSALILHKRVRSNKVMRAKLLEISVPLLPPVSRKPFVTSSIPSAHGTCKKRAYQLEQTLIRFPRGALLCTRPHLCNQ